KGQFLANVSHELRTPMNGVLGMISLMLATSLTAEQQEFAGIAQDSAESLLGIINDVLDFSRIEAGRLEIHEDSVDVRDLIRKVVAMIRARSQPKGLELSAWCDPELPRYLLGDAARLRQVLANLLINAVKFTERGSVVLEVRRQTGADGSPWLGCE